MNLFKVKLKEKELLIICLLILIIINLPYFVLKGDFFVGFGYDSLDSNVIWFKLLVESGKLFAHNSEIIKPALGGLPRAVYSSELSVETMLYAFFSPLSAYIINLLLIQLLAFAGMILLLKKFYRNNNLWVIYFVSLIFSCLKFWPHAGISIAGLPLLIYAYFLSKERFLPSFILMIFYVFYSNLILTGIFLLFLLFVDQIRLIAKNKFVLKQFLFLMLMGFFYILSNFRLVLATINPFFISHRFDQIMSTFGFNKALKTFVNNVFFEHGHNVRHAPFIMLITLIWIVFCLIRKIEIDKMIFKLLSLIGLLSLLSVLLQTNIIYGLYSKIELLRTIQLQRFYWLMPPVYYVLLFVVLKDFLRYKRKIQLIFGILLIQFLIVFSTNTNWRQIVKTKVLGSNTEIITYNQFYSSELYTEIKYYIGKEQGTYRVASLGLQPAAALYNGFYTIDGYFANYPKKYKDSFYLIMKDELKKNIAMEKFFVNWGSVCVLLSDEMIKKLNGKGYIVPTFKKNSGNVINDLSINTNVMRGLNCKYLFSAFKINNFVKLGMRFEKYFENMRSPYAIYLYSL